VTLTATVAVPHPHLEPATATLRLRLSQQLADKGLAAAADWAGLVVTEPRESTDPYGRPWFWYRGTLQVDPTGPGHGAAGQNTVAQASPWPVRPAPRPGRTRWQRSLSTPDEATRMRKDLRGQLLHGSSTRECSRGAGEDLLLAFEELTSNALRHGTGAVDVTIAPTAAGWLLVVDDEAPDQPPLRTVGRDPALGGMGLAMVASLSLDHGWHAGHGRKSVWAELPSRR
jgi:hypothetical protein